MKSYQALLIPFGPHLSMRIYVMWLIIESICSTYVIKSQSAPLSTCLSVSLHSCLSVSCTLSSLTFRQTFVLAFVLPYKTNQFLKGLKLLSKISSKLLMQAVSIAQWQEEIKLFVETTGDGRDSLFFLRLSLSDVLRPPFYIKTDLRTCRLNIKTSR